METSSIHILDYALLSRDKIDSESWTTNLEETLRATSANLRQLVMFHHDAMEHFQKLDRITNVTSIVAHGVLSVIQIVVGILAPHVVEMGIVVQVLTHGLLIYVTILGVYQFGSRGQDHKLSSIEFLQLEMHINTQLELPRNLRHNPGQYYEWVNNTYTSRLHKAPTLPNHIQQRRQEASPSSPSSSNSSNGVDELLDYQISRFYINSNNNNLG